MLSKYSARSNWAIALRIDEAVAFRGTLNLDI
jgi:hypothetical protein